MDHSVSPSTPVTPVLSTIESFADTPQFQEPPHYIQFTSSRRPSNATCSSSSSLYDVSLNYHDIADETIESTSQLYSDDDAFLYDEEDADSTDTETLNNILPRSLRKGTTIFSSASKSISLISKDWNESLKSPTYMKAKKSEYLSSPIESTPIFKRIVNKNSLKPQLKSFKRITKELQGETDALQSEINHEKLMLLSLKDEQKSLGSGFMTKNNKIVKEQEGMTLKKFDIIRRANETWNQKKIGSILKEKSRNKVLDNPEAQNKLIRKRSRDETSSNFKRRAVSTSPTSNSIFGKDNLKLLPKSSKGYRNDL